MPRPGSGTILAACARTVNLDGHKILQLSNVPGRVFSFIGGGRGQWLGGHHFGHWMSSEAGKFSPFSQI